MRSFRRAYGADLLDQRLPELLQQNAVHDLRLPSHPTPGHEHILDAMQRRLDRRPGAMMLRRRTVEHVFGTLKHSMGSTHFLTRGLEHVSTEMSGHVLAYNFERVINCSECRKRCSHAASGRVKRSSHRVGSSDDRVDTCYAQD